MATENPGGEWGIGERIERLETIAETLEEGDTGLETAKDLREEADDHLEVLRSELDVGDGEIVEMEADAADVTEDEA